MRSTTFLFQCDSLPKDGCGRIGGDGRPAVEIGGNRVVVMAGPCSVESRDQVERVSAALTDILA